MSAGVGHQGHLSLMSCVRESSPQESVPDLEGDKNVASKRRFWNPRKWFKRKVSKPVDDGSAGGELPQEIATKETTRSRSTSEISETDEPIRRRSGTPLYPGLSVSHDSIFHSPHSGSELELEGTQSSSSLSITHHHKQQEVRLQTELSEKLRLRRGREDTSEDDEGLPRSPCNSPTTTEGLFDKTGIKDHPTKSHSTCSDGSLLSMGSLEMEEDFGQQSSRHSSKISLHEKRTDHDSYLELRTSAPLNHSAAHHKVAVRPKRTHGAPNRKRIPQIATTALPVTPEVNEEPSLRSLTPDANLKEPVIELYSSMNHADTRLKCSSLPPGLAGPGIETKLNRSRSSAGSKSQDIFSTLGEEEEDEKEEKKRDGSIFSRLFPRRSARKKKATMQVTQTSPTNVNIDIIANKKLVGTSAKIAEKIEIRPNALPRSGAASRQRVQPIDIPESPDAFRKDPERDYPSDSPDKSLGTSPLQMELENHFRQRKTAPLSSSPKLLPPMLATPPQSPKRTPNSPRSPRMEQTHYTKRYFESSSRFEETRSKVKIAGLSSLQQRVMQHKEEDLDEPVFKSLSEFTIDNAVEIPVVKSNSFKTDHSREEKLYTDDIFKSSSLDSVKDELVKSSSSLDSASSTKTSSTEYLDSLNHPTNIVISGPSHTSVVTVSQETHTQNSQTISTTKQTTVTEQESHKEQKVSITKIHVKREFKEQVPEFLHIHLNKVDAKPPTNVVLTANVNSAKTPDEKVSKPSLSLDVPQRKFSQDEDDIEIVDKDYNSEKGDPTPPSSVRIYKKHSESGNLRKSSDSRCKASLRIKSNSLDIVDSLKKPEIVDTIEKIAKTSSTNDLQELIDDGVVLRKKSSGRGKAEDEPELLKVFARRSLKVKDAEELSQQILVALEQSENQSKDSDKENRSSQQEERKKSSEIVKEQLTETKVIESTEVTLRKGSNYINNNNNNNGSKTFFPYTRTASVTVPKTNECNLEKVQKHNSFCDRPKTDISNKGWPNIKDDEDVVEEEKSDFINDDYPSIPKNFNQRKAEWERRSQGIQDTFKKNTP